MRPAVTILLALAVLGLLIRAWFAPSQPFGVLRESIRLLPWFIRRKWGIWLPLVLLMAIAAVAPLAASLISQPLLRSVVALGLPALVTAALALVAIRIHRGLILRERVNHLTIGAREIRMAGYVLLVWLVILAVRFIPNVLPAGVPGIALRATEYAAVVASWLMIVALALVGPSASLDDPTPIRTSWTAFRKDFFGIAGTVVILQGVQAVAGLAMASGVYLAGYTAAAVGAATLGALALLVVTFIGSELALAILLTRIFENRYDETRARDYNASWM